MTDSDREKAVIDLLMRRYEKTADLFSKWYFSLIAGEMIILLSILGAVFLNNNVRQLVFGLDFWLLVLIDTIFAAIVIIAACLAYRTHQAIVGDAEKHAAQAWQKLGQTGWDKIDCTHAPLAKSLYLWKVVIFLLLLSIVTIFVSYPRTSPLGDPAWADFLEAESASPEVPE
jgi:hypothetical protein